MIRRDTTLDESDAHFLFFFASLRGVLLFSQIQELYRWFLYLRTCF